MSSDILIFDNFSELKRMLVSEPFKLIQDRYSKEREKFLKKLLCSSTTDEETVKIKAVINALDRMSPAKIGEELISRASKRTKERYPELIR